MEINFLSGFFLTTMSYLFSVPHTLDKNYNIDV